MYSLGIELKSVILRLSDFLKLILHLGVSNLSVGVNSEVNNVSSLEIRLFFEVFL